MIKKFKLFESTDEIKHIEKYTMSDILDLSKSSLGMKEVYKYAEINDYKFTDYTIRGIVSHLKNTYNLNSHDNNLYNPIDSTKVITLNLEQQSHTSQQSQELIKTGDIYTFRVHFRSNKNLCIHVNKSFMYKFLSIPDPKSKQKPPQRIEMIDPKGILVWDNGKWVEHNKDTDFTQKPFGFEEATAKPIGFQIPTPKKKISTKEMKDLLGKIKDKKKL